MEMLGDKFKGLQAHNSKKSATIEKLKEDISHLQHTLHERDERVKYLVVEIEVERRESAVAFEWARLARQEVESLRIQLKEEVDAHELQKKEADRAALEVALACKAYFDSLLAQLPRQLQSDPDHFYYPSCIASCLDALKEIERKGGGLVLDVDNEDEESEESGAGSARDSGVSRHEDDQDVEARLASQSIR